MKRKVYILGIMLFAGLVIQAQEWIATTNLPGNIKNTIIRQYQENKSISYIYTDRGCYFAWSDNQSVIKLVEIDCNYQVKDFEICVDTVCFCGTDGTNGFVGWFRIPDLMSCSDAFHIYDNYITHEPNPTPPPPQIASQVICFNDLTIFEDPEDPLHRVHIALVGKNGNSVSCVAELKGFFNSGTWTYTTGTSETNAGTMDHVISTDQYIVAAGITKDEISISLRIFPKTSMLTSLLGDVLHKYPWIFPTYCFYPVGSFQITPMYEDLFATTSLYWDASVPPSTDGFITHVFDASATAYSPAGLFCVDSRLKNVSNGGSDRGVNSLTYSGTKHALAGLIRSNNPIYGNSSLFGELLWPFPASADYFVNKEYLFYSHDKFFSENGYLSMGNNNLQTTELAILARHLLTTNDSYCGKEGHVVTDTGYFAMKNDDYPLELYSQPFVFDDIPIVECVTLQLDIICKRQKQE